MLQPAYALIAIAVPCTDVGDDLPDVANGLPDYEMDLPQLDRTLALPAGHLPDIISVIGCCHAGLYVASPVEDYVIACTADTGSFEPGEQHMAQLLSSKFPFPSLDVPLDAGLTIRKYRLSSSAAHACRSHSIAAQADCPLKSGVPHQSLMQRRTQ